MDTLNMDTRKLEILKNDTAIMLSLAEPGAGGDIIARMDPSTCNAEALRELVRRWNSFPALVRVLKEAADLLYASMDEKQPGGSYGHDCHLAHRKAEELLNTRCAP